MPKLRLLHLAFASIFALLTTEPGEAFVGSTAAKILVRTQTDEAVEAAAKLSGRKTLSQSAQRALSETVELAAKKYGDDVILATQKGGLELIEAAAKHGDEVWKMAQRVPEGSRVLGLRADELVPLARQYGDDVLRLEAKHAGTTQQVISTFGREGLENLASQSIPKADYFKILAYGRKADTPQIARELLEGYAKEGGRFLERLPAKQILAYGLSAAMITAAWNVSDGVGDAVRDSPGIVADTGRAVTESLLPATLPIGIGCGIGFLILLMGLARRLKGNQ